MLALVAAQGALLDNEKLESGGRWKPPTSKLRPAGDEPPEAYREIRRRGLAELEAGHLEPALAHFKQALEIAEQSGDQNLADLAFCNKEGLLITLGRFQDPTQLREILVRAGKPEIGCIAAYNLSRAYHEIRKEYKKALFYAQIARDRARAAGRADMLAQSHNRMGKSLVAESRFDAAIAELELALEQVGEAPSIERIGILVNLAYPLALTGERKKAFSILFYCLRWYRRQSKKLHEAWPHICLCHLYADLGRLRQAWVHGHKGLELAEATGDSEAVRASLYLLGDIEKMAGEYDDAYGYFTRLRDEFYPSNENLPETLLYVEARQLVNLRA